MIPPKIFFCKNLEIKLIPRTWMSLKPSVMIFQTLETSAPCSLIDLGGLCNLTSLHSPISSKHYLILMFCITGTKIINTGNFLWNGSSKIQFFTNIWHPFWQRPLRPREVKKVSNSGSGINFHYSGTHWASVFGRFVKASGQARSLLCVNS